MKCYCLAHPDLKEESCSETRCQYCPREATVRLSFKGKIEEVCNTCAIRRREWLIIEWLRENGIYDATEERLEKISEARQQGVTDFSDCDCGYNPQTNTLTLNDGDLPAAS